jgi:hypothetical protein
MILQTAVPAVREARRSLLQRVLLPGPAPRRRRRPRGSSRTSSRRASSTSSARRRCLRDRRLRQDVPRHVQRARAHRRRTRVVWRRGIPLEDMEMFQFHPTGLARGSGCCCSEAARGRGRHRPEQRGRALHGALRPHDQGPRAARHGLAAIYQEIKEGRGGGPNGDWAYLDISHLDPKVIEGEAPRHHRVRADLPEGRADEGARPDPADAHYAMGGIPTDTDGRVVTGAERRSCPACTPRANARA